MSVPERATITNMGAELGVTTSVFPSDEVTKGFLHTQKRVEDWLPLHADPDASYDRVLDIDLTALEPLAACPHSPDNVRPIREIGSVKVDQVCIGSCTNSSYKDLATVAEILRGRKVNPWVSLVIAPGSRQVLMAIARDGYLTPLLEAGARIMESACGFCIGIGQSPPSGGVSLRTSNRNFFGRSGTKDALVYLVSPEVAAVSAITGRITDPRDTEIPYPQIVVPDRFPDDDGLMIPPRPLKEREKIEIIRGPNIGQPPVNEPLASDISGVVAIKLGDKITTDHIIPGGERMKYRSNIARYADYVFEVIDSSFAARAKAIKERGKANIIVAGLSYGQGSSREHAAICPMYLGVKAVIARSFERIHAANLVNFGILPLTFEREEDYQRIEEGDELFLREVRECLKTSRAMVVENLTRSFSFTVGYTLTEREKRLIMAGGALNMRRR